MSIDSPKHDIALSFLARDEGLAARFNEKLSDGFEVFFFPRKQEELAGTDGQETMRTPFREESRVVVVLYREPWGRTPWTAVEETAIKDRGLERGWNHLFFVSLSRECVLPKWLPDHRIRFNYEDFGFEEAIGAIKARTIENGARYTPLTASKRAQLFRSEEEYRRDRSAMSLSEIQNNARRLFKRIEELCAEIDADGSFGVRCGTDFSPGAARKAVVLTDDHVGVIVSWNQRFDNSLEHACLKIEKYSGRLYPPGEQLHPHVFIHQPTRLEEIDYYPDLSRAREYVWKRPRQDDFFNSDDLAQKCVIAFIDLVDKQRRGKIPR